MTTSLTDFPAGHTFSPIVLDIDHERVRAYRDAVGDACAIYEKEEIVPPLALAAFALGALLNNVGLPPGTLHVNEALEFLLPVSSGAYVECRARLVQRSVRAGMIASAIESELWVENGVALTARATVFCPVPAS